MILVAYTAGYRDGGPHLRQAARTLAREQAARGERVQLHATETKRAFVDAVSQAPVPITALHLIGHSGMYGPMFGTTALPEQFSPHEWRSLAIPFAPEAEAFFHACRTGRWFAPFFARTFGVTTHGHHLYTTVSRSPHQYQRVPRSLDPAAPVYVVGQPGRKSHGLLGSVGKHTGLLPPVPMQRHLPEPARTGADYDRVAHLYDRTFTDIRVRGPEWTWLSQRLSAGQHVLDLGCGTGALLRALEDCGVTGVGADVSGAMLDRARSHRPHHPFVQLDGPSLPFADHHFDAVVSLLSWRYLDWDPILAEVARVLRPGGRLLLVDMVARPADPLDWPRLLRDTLASRQLARRHPGYTNARARLVADPAWAEMLRYNPIRAEHEYRWFFESRFPGRTVDTLHLGRRSRVVAFDSGPITERWFPPQSYP